LKKTKYSDNEINTSTIIENLKKNFYILPNFRYDEANVPISIFVQKEQEYRKFFEISCDFLKFDYPEKSGMVYDFKINGYKVQEKVGSLQKNGLIYFTLHKNKSKANDGKRFQSYSIGDNDFYWLNFPDKRHFFIFPEVELIKHRIVCNESNLGSKSFSVNLNNMNTCKFDMTYLFDVENLDKDKIKKLFNI
jgi:hypothetical protein